MKEKEKKAERKGKGRRRREEERKGEERRTEREKRGCWFFSGFLPLYPSSEVLDGGGTIARDEWESVWG